MSTVGLFDHIALGGLSAAFALYLVSLGRSCLGRGGPRWARLGLVGTLMLLALDVQAAALMLLIGPDGTQDGLLRGDVRVRNALGVALSGACWAAALGRWAYLRSGGEAVVHSDQPSARGPGGSGR